MWTDKETNVDFLNYSEVAELALDLIKNPNMLPLSLGIFGGWGAGKSSMLCLVRDDLVANPDKFITVEFDAWLYQDYDDARAALMDVIAKTLFREAKENEALTEKVKIFSKRINYFRLAGLVADMGAATMGVPMFGAITKGSDALDKMLEGEAGKEEYDALKAAGADSKKQTEGLLKAEKEATPPEEITEFRKEFGEILEELSKTLIVFIDNLDRCLPKNAIHTLEAVRLFLFLPNTAFVIAADEEMIRHAVSEHYGNLNERLVTDYLDKLIQVPIQVPRLGVHEVRAYMFMLFAQISDISEELIETLRLKLEESLRKSWKEEPTSVDDVLKTIELDPAGESATNMRIADRLATILAKSSRVKGNPRIVKRLLNIVRLRSSVANRRKMSLDEALIAKFTLFERCTNDNATEELYRIINDAANGKPDLLKELESLTDDPDKFESKCPDPWKGDQLLFVSEWFTLDPQLSIDLRPVLYLSKETMPLRYSKAGLSESATEALKTLLRAPSRASRAAQMSIGSVDKIEYVALMEAVVSELRKESDWNKKPKGFDGALILADSSLEAGKALGAFINSLGLSKLPPWLNTIVKEASWYTGNKGK